MNGAVGTYLALTSERLTGPNVFYSGIATHYLHSSTLPDLEARLSELQFSDRDTVIQRMNIINSTLEEYATGLPHDQPMQISGEIRNAVDRCFSKDNINDIIAALKEERGATEEWAQKQLDTLQKRSPTAVHVALRQMRVSKGWDIAETFKREHQIATQFMKHPDFSEGVTALLVRKEKPKWQPESLDAISSSESVTKPFFEYDSKNTLQLFTNRTYKEYPYPQFGLPTEKEIEEIVKASGNEGLTRSKLIAQVVESRGSRQGVEEVVTEIIERKTEVASTGKVTWLADSVSSASKL